MTRPRILDAFCGAGGAAVGYHQAGFDVVGVDHHSQPRYPYPFLLADAVQLLAIPAFLAGFDAIHASPPCQAYTAAQSIRGRTHPDLVAPVRDLLAASGLPWVIENVVGAPLRDPVELCGCMFAGLNVYRRRRFESSIPLAQPEHAEHRDPMVKLGRAPQPGHRMHVVGNFTGAAAAREAMGIGWMTRDELSEAIPPVYTTHIGTALIAHVAASSPRAA